MTLIARYASQCIGYFETIKITDMVDILIIAVILYRLFLFLRKTQASKVLKGIILLLLALAVSYQFNLHILTFILNSAVNIGLLALIVLFQPEIRRFLEQVSSIGLFKFFGSQERSTQLERAIEQTVAAFQSMSEERIGALVVFERNNVLDEYTKSGTELDASVSSELMKNIFFPKAPLHDGAVLVRKARIVSAGCVQPLTHKMNVSRDLCTRHRAAIGISEHTDAIVAIVSEETGAISVAVGGMLKRHLTVDTLDRLLRNELLPTQAEDSRRAAVKIRRHKKEGASDVE